MIILLLLLPISVFTFTPFNPLPNKCPVPNHFPIILIRNVSVPSRRQFFQIISSINDTKSQIETKLINWANDNKIQLQYENFTLNIQQHLNNNYDNYNKWLTGEALILLKKLWDIRKNMEITRCEECKQINQILESTDPKLRCFIPIPQSVIPGPPPSKCFPLFKGEPFNNKNNEVTLLPNLKLEDEKSLENNNSGNSTIIENEEEEEKEEDNEEK